MNPTKTIHSIQALRGLAAMMVVLHHALLTSPKYYAPGLAYDMGNAYAGIGQAGVDIFFVISGYIMLKTRGSHFARAGASLSFLRDRLLRVAPMYWLFTGLSIAISLAAPSLSSAEISPTTVISALLFFPMDKYPIVKVGWSLNYEMYFYLVFALLLLTRRSLALPAALLLIAASMALRCWMPAHAEGALFLPYLMTDPLLLEFAAGALIAAFTEKHPLPQWAATPLLCSAVLWLLVATPIWPSESLRVFSWGVPGALLVSAATALHSLPGLAAGVSTRLGDASYSIYLSHPFAMPAMGVVWVKTGLVHLPPWIYVACSLAACASVGLFVHQDIERRLTQATKARFASAAGRAS